MASRRCRGVFFWAVGWAVLGCLGVPAVYTPGKPAYYPMSLQGNDYWRKGSALMAVHNSTQWQQKIQSAGA